MLFFSRLALLIAIASQISGIEGADTGNACGVALSESTPSAQDVYACLTSTPFRADIATELLDYWKTTMRFQSTLSYLRDPPRSYQQPPVDLLRGLDLIRAQIDTGVFDNQYAFEAAVQTLMQATHDGNVYLAGSVMGVFTFGIPVNLVAVSDDGVSLPQVYVAEDLLSITNASPVVRINGELAEDFLAVFGSENSFGYVEPHSDWNGLMFSAAGQLEGAFGSATETIFYPGDTFIAEFANGTTIGPHAWSAYNIQGGDLTNLQTGEDFYNYFVLGQLPATAASTVAATITTPPSTDTTAATASATDTPDDGANTDTDESVVTGWGGAYPDTADVTQPNLGYGGILTGYFLNDTKTGVLSIPDFLLTNEASLSFSSTIGEFLQRSKEAEMEKIVIDLQSNDGGAPLLAIDTFSQFFPNIQPFVGMRSRSFALADQLGNTFTNHFLNNASALNDSFYSDLSSSPFTVVVNELNAYTKANFTSWGDYFGPHPEHGDAFSTLYTYNLTNITALAEQAYTTLLSPESRHKSPPYDARDIVLLTDGACGSECDLFVELMHHAAGVRTIVVGGLPQYGPMQARGSARGAMLYTSDSLDGDFQVACALNQTLCNSLPNRTSDALDQSRMLFNFADQIRPQESVPLQFVYEAADCRIFFKTSTFYNYTALWEHAAEASFRNGTLCLPHSAEHNNTMVTDVWGPSPEQLTYWASTNAAYVARTNANISAIAALAQGEYDAGLHTFEKKQYAWQSISGPSIQDALCKTDTDCTSNANTWTCQRTTITCNKKPFTTGMCKRACISNVCSPGSPVKVQNICKGAALPGSCGSKCYCNAPGSENQQAFCAAQAGGLQPVVTASAGAPMVIDIRHVKWD